MLIEHKQNIVVHVPICAAPRRAVGIELVSDRFGITCNAAPLCPASLINPPDVAFADFDEPEPVCRRRCRLALVVQPELSDQLGCRAIRAGRAAFVHGQNGIALRIDGRIGGIELVGAWSNQYF